MTIYKKHFKDLCKKVRESGKATIKIVREEENSNSDVAAYVYLSENPPKIILKKEKKYTYKQLILDLLHEFGHVLDYEKYKKSKRWKIWDSYGKYSLEKAKCLSKNIKVELIKTEYIAEKYVQRLLKRYNLFNLFEEARLEAEVYLQIQIRKHELIIGKYPTNRKINTWVEKFKDAPFIVTVADILDFYDL
jgi:hypothetical protein